MATLREVMTAKVCTTGADATVSEAADAMVRGRIGSAMVMQGTMLLGILTERDVLRAAAAGTDVRVEKVSRWMTPEPVTAGPDTVCTEATELMLGQGFRHLPVVDGDEVIGVVSLRDVLGARR
jgi:CBS domain-containing protein